MIEILIATAALAILLGVAIPGMQNLVTDSRRDAAYHNVAATLRYARSESIKRSGYISVCPMKTESSCGNDWSRGLLVFTDLADDGRALAYDGKDAPVRVVKFSSSRLDVSSSVVSANGAPAARQDVIRFNDEGRADWACGYFVFHNDRGEQRSRALMVFGSGVVREVSHVPPVANGMFDEVTCS